MFCLPKKKTSADSVIRGLVKVLLTDFLHRSLVCPVASLSKLTFIELDAGLKERRDVDLIRTVPGQLLTVHALHQLVEILDGALLIAGGQS